MELRELEYIVTIAREGSISRAAERLYMAQSSLSQFLQKYESELGTKLFMCTASGVRLTYSGEVFIKGAKQILFQYHQLRGELGDIEQLRSGRIEFGISTYRGTHLLPRVMRRFYELYPQVEVVIHEEQSKRLEERIAAGELDMALIVPQGEEIPCDPVMRDEVCILAHPRHPVTALIQQDETGNPYVDLREAAKFPFFLSGPSTILGGMAERMFTACGAFPRTLSADMSVELSAAMARQGLGLAFTYRSYAEESSGVHYLSIGKERVYLDLALIYPAGGYQSRATRALAELIRQHMAGP